MVSQNILNKFIVSVVTGGVRLCSEYDSAADRDVRRDRGERERMAAGYYDNRLGLYLDIIKWVGSYCNPCWPPSRNIDDCLLGRGLECC